MGAFVPVAKGDFTMSDQNLSENLQDLENTVTSVSEEPHKAKGTKKKVKKAKYRKLISKIPKLPKLQSDPLEEYGNGIFKKLGGIIKAISFIVSSFFFFVVLVLALLLYMIDPFFLPFAIALVILGAITALIVMFLIYGLGQVICQNNEILTRLQNK